MRTPPAPGRRWSSIPLGHEGLRTGWPGLDAAGQPGDQVSAGWSAETPFCQAAAPAAAAVLACAHLILACSRGGVSISLIHWRVAESMCEPPRARPARAIRVPAPTSAALVIS